MSSPPDGIGAGVRVVVVSVVFSILAIAFVGARIWAKAIRSRTFRDHDYYIFAASLFSVGYGVNAITGVYLGGSGQHVSQILENPSEGNATLVAALKNFFATAFMWAFATCLCKLSVLSLYLELFPTPRFRRAVRAVMCIVCAFWLGLVLTGFLICRPLALNWDRTLKGECGSTVAEEIAFAVVNMIIDGTIVVLPMPVLWSLQMPITKKISVSCMFGLGFVICVMNATRIGIVARANEADFSYSLVDVAILSGLEVWLGVVAACAPTLWPIFRRQQNRHWPMTRPAANNSRVQNLRTKYPWSNNFTSTASSESWRLADLKASRPWRKERNRANFERFDEVDTPRNDTYAQLA